MKPEPRHALLARRHKVQPAPCLSPAKVLWTLALGLLAMLGTVPDTVRAGPEAPREVSVIISAPVEVIGPHLEAPEYLARWLPWALGADPDEITATPTNTGRAWRWSGPDGLTVEGRLGDAQASQEWVWRLSINGASAVPWRMSIEFVGHYGYRVRLTFDSSPGLEDPLAPARALSVLRGEVLGRFGAEGGSYQPPR